MTYILSLFLSFRLLQEHPDVEAPPEASGTTTWKYAGWRITSETSPGTKKSIMEEREERKRVTSRKWHTKFVAKGAS